jgi:hypothetical protein
MVCRFVSSEKQSQIMAKPTQNSLLMQTSSLQAKPSLECPATNNNEDDIDKKRRQLLIRSAKRPFKRSRLQQKQCNREEKDETDTVTTASLSSSSTATTKSPKSKKSKGNLLRRLQRENRRIVSFDTKYNTTSIVASHTDLTETERRSYYFQRDEYVGIKRNIQRTIEFLKSPNDASLASVLESKPSGNTFAEEHCVRGLECLAEEFVNEHKKRVQKSSKSAVFRFQENRRRRRLGKSRSVDEASLALAEIYIKYTSQCKSIAIRWGHFDAIDAGIDPAATSSSSATATAVTCETATSLVSKEPVIDNNITVETPVDNNASLSSLSYDGDDGEEEENDNESSDDFNLPPVVDAGKSANGFDSLPDGLFNF